MELVENICYNTHMKRSMYSRYKEEFEDVYTIETSFGFANYKVEVLTEEECQIYVQEVYVLPESRGKRKAAKLTSSCISDAFTRFKTPVTKVFTSVAVKGNNVEKSLRAITEYGFKLAAANQELIYFYKEISHE